MIPVDPRSLLDKLSRNMTSVNAWTALWAQQKGLSQFYVPETGSTNAWAKADFQPHTQSAVFLADHQTQGRGRGTHQWVNTEPGANLLSTWCFALPSPPHPLFNMRVGYALYESVKKTWPRLSLALKAPNDLYLNGGKLAGILTEVVTGGTPAVFIGIGLNAFSKPELNDQTTRCLSDELTLDTQSWCTFCDHLFRRLGSLTPEAFRGTLLVSEKDEILLALKNYPGNVIEDIEPDGSLRLGDGSVRHWNDL